jgi:putative ABC transport system permease protein
MNDEIRKNGTPAAGNVTDEVAFHLEMRTQELIDAGMDPAQARAEARRRFGDVREVTAATRREDHRARATQRRAAAIGELGQDLRIGLRRLVQAPGFAALAILILALAIGANSAIFSVLNAVVLQPLPYPEPDQLTQVWESSPKRGFDYFSVSQLNYVDFRDRNQTFESLAGVGFNAYNLALDDEVIRVDGRHVSVEFFDTLGVRPTLGRAFTAEENTPGNESNVVILSDEIWRNRVGADPEILGKSILINNVAFTIIGVLPTGSFFFDEPDLFLPLRAGTNTNRSDHGMVVLGRLKKGVTVEQGEADLDAIAAQLAIEYPDSNEGFDTRVSTLYDSTVPAELRRAVYVLVAAVGLVLLIACANLSSLLLARATARQREIAIYSALGASRGRIVRQMLTETTLLAVLGGALGTAVAFRAVAWFRVLDPGRLPRFETLAVDGTVLLFALGTTLATALLAGLLPAWQAAGSDPQDTLKASGRGTSASMGTRRARQALLAGEVALSIVLLASAGLLIRSFWTVQSIDPGLDPDGVLSLGINMPVESEEEFMAQPALFRQMLEQIAAVPGVASAATISGLPFAGGATSMDLVVEGRDHGEIYPSAYWRLTSPDYFETMGIPLLEGRTFLPEESDGGNLAIISASMATSLWPDEDPIGQRFLAWQDPERIKTVVGVVGDVRERSLETEATNMVYMPHLQMTWWSNMHIVVRTDGDPADVASSVRAAIARVVPDRPVSDVRPLAEVLDDTLGSRRFNTSLLLAFAAVALVLAAAGVYGVMAYSVAQRTSEIGIRMAMGARAANVVGMVVGQGMSVVGAGIGVGLVVAFATTRLLASMLYGVDPSDPLTLGSAVLFLSLVALAACALPALRATRVHPTEALREA